MCMHMNELLSNVLSKKVQLNQTQQQVYTLSSHGSNEVCPNSAFHRPVIAEWFSSIRSYVYSVSE